jgi:hypothetical protein
MSKRKELIDDPNSIVIKKTVTEHGIAKDIVMFDLSKGLKPDSPSPDEEAVREFAKQLHIQSENHFHGPKKNFRHKAK